jgi:hypothetical protein
MFFELRKGFLLHFRLSFFFCASPWLPNQPEEKSQSHANQCTVWLCFYSLECDHSIKSVSLPASNLLVAHPVLVFAHYRLQVPAVWGHKVDPPQVLIKKIYLTSSSWGRNKSQAVILHFLAACLQVCLKIFRLFSIPSITAYEKLDPSWLILLLYSVCSPFYLFTSSCWLFPFLSISSNFPIPLT